MLIFQHGYANAKKNTPDTGFTYVLVNKLLESSCPKALPRVVRKEVLRVFNINFTV